jgi:hypothetical protein
MQPSDILAMESPFSRARKHVFSHIGVVKWRTCMGKHVQKKILHISSHAASGDGKGHLLQEEGSAGRPRLFCHSLFSPVDVRYHLLVLSAPGTLIEHRMTDAERHCARSCTTGSLVTLLASRSLTGVEDAICMQGR